MTPSGSAFFVSTTRAARSGKVMLWVATVLVVGFAVYPYLAGGLEGRSATGSVAPVAGAVTVRIRVKGMTCAGCASTLANRLAKVEGVVKAEVAYEAGIANVTYDPTRVKPEQLVEAVRSLGYEGKLGDEASHRRAPERP